MTKAILAAILLVLGAGVHYLYSGGELQTPQSADSTTGPAVIAEDNNSHVELFEITAHAPASPTISKEESIQRTQKIAETKQALDELIAQYDANLGDSEQKQALKVKMDKLMAEYNQLILPDAVSAVKDKSSQ